MNSSDSLKQEFVAEAREHLERVERELIFLEKQPENPDPERIVQIFRSIHSIKGAAGFMGYKQIADISHVMETLLQMMRKGIVMPESHVVNPLFSGNDLLKSMLDDPDTSDKMDIRRIVGVITDLIDSEGDHETRKKIDRLVPLANKQGADIGFSVSEFGLDNIQTDYDHIYLLKFNLNELEKTAGIKPLSLSGKLLENGNIIESRMETDAADFDQSFSRIPLMNLVLYATNQKVDDLPGRSVLGPGDIVEVEKNVGQPKTKPEIPSGENECAPCFSDMKSKASEDHHDTIRLRVDVLDRLMKLAGELVLVRNNLLSIQDTESVYRRIFQRLNTVTSELQETIMQTRMQPVGNLFGKLPRIVRDLSMKLNKQIEITATGNDVELDKTILESLTDPLIHLIRNSCDHGIETPKTRRKSGKPPAGRIEVAAWHEAGQINIRISDDGKGIDSKAVREKAIKNGMKTEEELSRMNEKEILSLVVMHGFSTTDDISDVSGRGVGMDVVKAGVERIGGSMEIDSSLGEGTRIELRLPLTLAIIPCMIVEVGGYRYAIPQVNLKELLCLYNEDVYTKIECAGDQEVFRLRNRLLPIVRLREVLGRRDPFTDDVRSDIAGKHCDIARRVIEGEVPPEKMLNFCVVKMGTKRYGLVVDQIIGVEEIVVNPMHHALKPLGIYSGTTIMGDGTVALIFDIEGLAEHAAVRFNIREEELAEKINIGDETQTVLLFKNGPHEHFAVPLPMIRRVEHILATDIEKVGDREFVTVDGVSTLILRLEEHLNVSPCGEHNEMLVLLPKHIRRPFGILVSSVLDTAETDLDLNVESYMEAGLLGTAIIRDHMTLFIDLYRLIELSEPDWFEERKKKAPPPEKRKRILLVEDTLFFRHLVKRYLEADGYEVTAAENGKAAVELLGGKPFDIIVSDLDMPAMNGWEFMEYIRKESDIRNIPSIALTALDSDDDKTGAHAAGFDTYQVKLDREALLVNVSELLHRQGG